MKKKSQQLRKINARHYNYFQAIILSFYSSKLYIDVAKRWKGIGLRYLFIASVLLTIPFGIRGTLLYNAYFKQELVEPIKLIPSLLVKEGNVQSDKPMPWEIKNKQGRVKVIIDTSGKYKTLNEDSMPEVRVLITKQGFFFQLPNFPVFFNPDFNPSKPRVFEETFPPTMSGTISGQEVLKTSKIAGLQWLAILGFWPLAISTIFSLYLVLLLVFAMMGQLIAQVIFKHSMSYAQACRVMTVSITPQLTFLLIYLTTQWPQDFIKGISIVLFAVYFSYGVIVNRRDSKKLVRT